MSEKINLPFATEDGETEVPLLKHEDGLRKISTKEEDGFDRIHDWDQYTREVLNNILIAIEEKQRLGYFDSLIDVETNCNLIKMARAVYIDLFNENKNGTRFRNPRMKITQKDIEKNMKGGYSKEFQARLIKLLVNSGDIIEEDIPGHQVEIEIALDYIKQADNGINIKENKKLAKIHLLNALENLVRYE